MSSTLMSLMRRAASGARGAASPLPKYLMAGMRTTYESTPPPAMSDAIRGPMMYPTPSRAGLFSIEMDAASKGAPNTLVAYSLQVLKTCWTPYKRNPNPNPAMIVLPPAVASSA